MTHTMQDCMVLAYGIAQMNTTAKHQDYGE